MADLIFFLLTVRSLLVTVQQSHKGTAQKQAKQRLKLCFKVGLHYFLITVKKSISVSMSIYVSVCLPIHPCSYLSICVSVKLQHLGRENKIKKYFLISAFPGYGDQLVCRDHRISVWTKQFWIHLKHFQLFTGLCSLMKKKVILESYKNFFYVKCSIADVTIRFSGDIYRANYYIWTNFWYLIVQVFGIFVKRFPISRYYRDYISDLANEKYRDHFTPSRFVIYWLTI